MTRTETSDRSQASTDLLAGLNPAQRQAVEHAHGPLSILAGAGSGKTRVITRRIAHLVRAHGVPAGAILALTFTNKAAGEMRERVAALLPGTRTWVSTFHSLCARILRQEIEGLGGWTRDFTILDTADRNALLKKLLQRSEHDTTGFRPAQVGSWISARKNRGGGAREQIQVATEEEVVGREDELLESIERAYAEALRTNNALDFDDLLLCVLRLFDTRPGVRDSWAARFRHVLVDEYQDTNHVQYRILRHLAGTGAGLAVCGDPDQSIYAWRGADVRNILEFERDFPDATVVRLEQNYRSTETILKAAQAVIRNNKQRKEKDLWSERGEGSKLRVTECGDEEDEARELLHQIRGLVARGLRHDQIAVFYRVNWMQRAVERALRLGQVPYQIVAGTEFYQRREIKDLVAYLRVLVNPADGEAVRRALNVPQRGVGETSLAALERWAADRRVPLLRAVRSTECRSGIRGRAKKGIAAFAELVERLAPAADGPAAVALDQLIEKIDYWSWLALQADKDDVDRESNVEELRAHAEAYDRQPESTGLRGFLQDIALVSDADGLDESTPKVALMTMHAAKGLEFPAVFVVGVEEELVPHLRALEQASDPTEGEEEERRLFYVAMTRAQDHLFLTHARVRRHFGQDAWSGPSRFLEEIPPELVEGGVAEEDEADVLGEFAPADAAHADLAEGDWVEHDHFGRGRIEKLAGSGVNARATVRFAHHGPKQLLLAYAKLARVGGGAQ